ncbi:ribonuclease Z [Altericroceibacterium xinjiangense]|uniref:ribonuclease Z n=1 Tax=Altericroceibacterium xinjiangense TaxID=762261 RepID=UPI0013DF517F|nr:ribonuclease Z [Altericroceibacterium xinjiangense]
MHANLVNGRFGDAAILVERLHARAAFLFDLGDLSRLSARHLLRVEHVFVSHMHMDHFIGFDALLRVNVGRDKRIVVTGPPGVIACVGHKLAGYTWDLVDRYETDLVFHVIEFDGERLREAEFALKQAFVCRELDERSAREGTILETPSFTVRAALLEHHGPSLAYAVAEPIHVNVWRNRVEEQGLPLGQWLQGLKQAVREGREDDFTVPLPGGTSAPLGDLRGLVSVERGQMLGYVTDVRDTPDNRRRIATLCAAADTLFIEASFAAADRDKADYRAHLTTRAAGEIARMVGVRRVEPFHFSPRYEGEEQRMIDEVETAFRGEG